MYNIKCAQYVFSLYKGIGRERKRERARSKWILSTLISRLMALLVLRFKKWPKEMLMVDVSSAARISNRCIPVVIFTWARVTYLPCEGQVQLNRWREDNRVSIPVAKNVFGYLAQWSRLRCYWNPQKSPALYTHPRWHLEVIRQDSISSAKSIWQILFYTSLDIGKTLLD